MTLRTTALLLVMCCCQAGAQESILTVPREPVNLAEIKQKLIAYHDCPEADCYVPQLERQITLATKLLKESEEKAKPGDKLAIVLDIDETSLSNWDVEMHDDFGYIAADSNWYVGLRACPAIAATLRLYQQAEKDKVAVFFITGRPTSQLDATAKNLVAVGFDKWDGLSLRPDHPKDELVAVYKSGERAKILNNGYRIVLNVGDQMSDLENAPMAEHSVKLPNPFYFLK
jgi:predicted secreted acid phosphatase